MSSSRTILCREGLYYLVVLALVLGGAMLKGVNLMLMLAGMLAGPMLFSRWIVAASLRGLKVRRRIPAQVCAGDLLVVHFDLSNSRRRWSSWAVVAEDALRPARADGNGKPVQASVLFTHVPAGETRRGVYRGRLPRRGRYVLGPVRLSTRFPFGLFRHTITVDESDTLVVFPRLGRLARQWVARRHEAFAGTQRRHQRYGPFDGDFYGVRPWRQGDTRRWIHWRQSARHGALVVRQYEQPRNRDLVVVVELWQPARPRPADADNVELAVSFAATLMTDLCRTGGCDLAMGVAGRESSTIRGPAAVALLQDAMEILALAEADHGDRLPELLRDVLGNVDAGAEVVVISTRPVDLGDGERFGPLLQSPRRRALARRIRCIDASSEELAQYFEAE